MSEDQSSISAPEEFGNQGSSSTDIVPVVNMSSKNVRSPPSLSKCKSYDDWIKLVKIWRSCTDISKSRQGPELLLSLEGEAQDAALEVAEDEIVQDDGFDKIISRLDKLFKRDSTV